MKCFFLLMAPWHAPARVCHGFVHGYTMQKIQCLWALSRVSRVKHPQGSPRAFSHRRNRPPFEHPTLHHSRTPFHVLDRSSRQLLSLGRPFNPIRTFPKPSETIQSQPNRSEVEHFFLPIHPTIIPLHDLRKFA